MTIKKVLDSLRTYSREQNTEHHLNDLEDEAFQISHEGSVIGYVTTEKSLDKAQRMLELKLEKKALYEKLRLLEKKEKIAEEEFWGNVFEETGANNQQVELSFDPITGAIYKNKINTEHSSSMEKNMLGYKSLIKQMIEEPLTSHRMALDHSLPEWLRETAGFINKNDLKPVIRKTIEDGINNPELAQTWLEACKTYHWPDWLYETMKVLSYQSNDRYWY